MSGKDLGSEMAAANLEESTGRDMSWWINTAISSDETRHGEMVADLEEQHGSRTVKPTSLPTPPANQQRRPRLRTGPGQPSP